MITFRGIRVLWGGEAADIEKLKSLPELQGYKIKVKNRETSAVVLYARRGSECFAAYIVLEDGNYKLMKTKINTR